MVKLRCSSGAEKVELAAFGAVLAGLSGVATMVVSPRAKALDWEALCVILVPVVRLEPLTCVVGTDITSEGSGELGDPGYRNPVLVLDEASEVRGELGDPGYQNPVLVLNDALDGIGELGEPGYRNPLVVLDLTSEGSGEFGEPGYRKPVVILDAACDGRGELGEPGYRKPVLVLEMTLEGRGELGEPGYKNPVVVLDVEFGKLKDKVDSAARPLEVTLANVPFVVVN